MTFEELKDIARTLRAHYDALPPGAKATLRRCTTADELRAEGVYWRLIDEAAVPASARSNMAHVVGCFDSADAGRQPFARWLRHAAYGEVKPNDLPARSLRFRRLLAASHGEEMAHHLRKLLRQGFQKSRTGVDWGELGADIFFFGDSVRRRWAEQFFTKTTNLEESNHA